MTPVLSYFAETKTRCIDLARLVECSTSQMSRLINGEKRVNSDFAQRVETATKGALNAEDFIKSCMAARTAFLAGVSPKEFRKQALSASAVGNEG